MGRRGPAPTPSAVLKLAGSWRAKANPAEPTPANGEPFIPPKLSAAAREVWARTIDTIAPGVLTVDNGPTLARYCHNTVRWWKLAEWLDQNEDTYTVTDQLGNTRHVRHPNVITYEKLTHDLLRCEQEFGITPASRTRIVAKKTDGKEKGKERFFGGPRLATG